MTQHSTLSQLADLVFPRSCAGCGEWDTSMCEACAQTLSGRWVDVSPRLPYLRLIRPHKRDGPIFPGDEYSRFPVYSLGDYTPPARNIVVAWKNSVDASLTSAICSRVCEAARHLPTFPRELLVVPAPSRWWRTHDGRYVVGALAHALAAGIKAPPHERTARVVNALATGWGNAHGTLAGRRAKGKKIRVKRGINVEHPILLIDDVATTGATLAGAADALEEAGGDVVGAVTLLAVPDPRTKKT
ncbi:ComF family protein [Arcanobacterium haemolyticum]|nr:ComF family protein [Arcanobacterium haemolyticum]